MKNYKFLILFIAFGLTLWSCDDDIKDAIAPNSIGGTYITSFSNIINGIYLEGVGSSSAGFTIDGAEGDSFKTYDILVQLGDDGNTLGAISSGKTKLPASYDFTLSQVASALGLGLSDLKVGDNIHFLVKFDNGTSSSKSVTIPISCPSYIGGTHTYVSTNLSAITGSCPTSPVTGKVTWAEVSAGVYTTTDLGFGQYTSSCWNDSEATSASARITEVCGLFGTSGGDQYGLEYTYVIQSINGPELTISWSNTYGDSGVTVLTKQGGLDWPDDLYTN